MNNKIPRLIQATTILVISESVDLIPERWVWRRIERLVVIRKSHRRTAASWMMTIVWRGNFKLGMMKDPDGDTP